MIKYQCSVLDANQQVLSRLYEAENEQDLLSRIKQNQYYLISYEEVMAAKGSVQRLSIKELIIFCRQMSIMLQSGITVIKAIDILETKSTSKKARNTYARIYESLQKGNSLSATMQEEGVFPPLLIQMVEAGEAGGILEENLAKMAVNFEKDNKLRNKVKNAMMYPAVLGVIAVAVVIGLVTFVLPSFFTMFDSMADIPWPTQVIVGLSNIFTQYWLILIFAAGIIALLIPVFLKNPKVRWKVDNLKLRMPVFGPLNRTVYSSRCARTFATLYASGVPMIEILRMISKLLGNVVIEDSFVNVIERVTRGELISASMDEMNVFDPMFTSMVFIGEESGSMDTILNQAADYFDEEADAATQRMVGLIEPAMIVILAFIIGFIVIAIMLPMYGMLGQIG